MSTNIGSLVNVRVLFFAKTRELAGVDEANVLIAPNIVAGKLLSKISADFNLECIRNSIILAVNENYCDNLEETLHLREGDEIAVIPPISGG